MNGHTHVDIGKVEPKTHFAIFDMNTGKRYILIPDYD